MYFLGVKKVYIGIMTLLCIFWVWKNYTMESWFCYVIFFTPKIYNGIIILLRFCQKGIFRIMLKGTHVGSVIKKFGSANSNSHGQWVEELDLNIRQSVTRCTQHSLLMPKMPLACCSFLSCFFCCFFLHVYGFVLRFLPFVLVFHCWER